MITRENLVIALIGLLAGTSGGGAVSTKIMSDHQHPYLETMIRKVQYDGEIDSLSTAMKTMEDEGQQNTVGYKVVEAQLLKFTQMRTELEK